MSSIATRSRVDSHRSMSTQPASVPHVGICRARVAERVRKGGHSVPEADVRRRFKPVWGRSRIGPVDPHTPAQRSTTIRAPLAANRSPVSLNPCRR